MEIRIYTKSELALIYFPGLTPRRATQQLMRWVNRCEQLCKELAKTNYSNCNRIFSPRQVELIIQFLGEPDRKIT